jgi:hypothetical protein
MYWIDLMDRKSQIAEELPEKISSQYDLAIRTVQCQLSLNAHAIIEMMNDHLSDDDVRDVIISGTQLDNDNGDGDKYQKGCITVIADNKPCHFNVITAW